MSSSLLTGSNLGRYEVLSKIGEGGMAEVYLAEDRQLRRQVALKILPCDIAASQVRMRRFVQEAQAAAALNHPNIAHIYEIGEASGTHFIAMEFVAGQTLRDCMRSRTLKLVEALDFAKQIADALSAAHAAGVVHRDIKPENVAMSTDGYVKVLDFGLAKLSETDTPSFSRDPDASTLIHTEPGVVLGTLHYMSPEQARGLAVDSRSDIFSLGVVVYEMVAAHRPFEGATTSDLLVSILERKPMPLAHHVAETPAELERIVMKALEKEPEDRYQTVKEMAVDLRRLKRQLDSQSNRFAQSDVSLTPTALDKRKQSSSERFQTMKMARLTNSGKASEAAISPDGKYFVHVIDDGGQQSLWVRQVAPSNSVQINPPAAVHYLGLTFSHDGDSLYYVVREKNEAHGVLYQIPVLGGLVRRLMEGVDSPITLSPDGKRFGFLRNSYPSPVEETLMIANAEGTGETRLATRKRPNAFRNSALAWSPDGKVIACVVRSSDITNWHQYVVAVHVDGSEKQVSQKCFEIEAIEWLSDDSALLMNIKDQASLSDQIWQLSCPGGELLRITNDLNSYTTLSLTADSNAIVTVQTARISNIWTTKSEDISNAKQITSGTGKLDGWLGVCWTSANRVIYSSNAGGNFDIWIMEADGTGQKQLTSDARNNLWPAVSFDGRYIVFVSDRSGSPHIWRMNLDGTDPKPLTKGSGEFNPSCSPDGRWVVYGSAGSAKRTLWKVPIDGGESAQLTEAYSETPVVSPDGKLIACSYQEASNAPWRIAVVPFAGGQPAKTFAVSPTVDLPAYICWTLNGQALTYVDTLDGGSNIWSQSIDGGPPKQLTDFKFNRIVCFGWSFDGKQLALAVGTVTSDVVLISGFR